MNSSFEFEFITYKILFVPRSILNWLTELTKVPETTHLREMCRQIHLRDQKALKRSSVTEPLPNTDTTLPAWCYRNHRFENTTFMLALTGCLNDCIISSKLQPSCSDNDSRLDLFHIINIFLLPFVYLPTLVAAFTVSENFETTITN